MRHASHVFDGMADVIVGEDDRFMRGELDAGVDAIDLPFKNLYSGSTDNILRKSQNRADSLIVIVMASPVLHAKATLY